MAHDNCDIYLMNDSFVTYDVPMYTSPSQPQWIRQCRTPQPVVPQSRCQRHDPLPRLRSASRAEPGADGRLAPDYSKPLSS